MDNFRKEFERVVNDFQPIDEYDLNSIIYEIFEVKRFDEILINHKCEISQNKDSLLNISGNSNTDVKSIQEISRKVYELFDFILYESFRVIKKDITPDKLIFEFLSTAEFHQTYFSGTIIFEGENYETLFKYYKKDFIDPFK